MTILLWRRHGAGRDHGAALWCLGPGHELLIGPVPAPLPVRVGLQSPTHLPLPHRCLPPQTPPAGKGNSPEAAHASGAEAPPTELETPEAAQAEFVSCDQTISGPFRR